MISKWKCAVYLKITISIDGTFWCDNECDFLILLRSTMNEAGSSQSEDGYVPSAKEATDLVTKFAEVTGTDTVRHGPAYFYKFEFHLFKVMLFLN